MESPSEPDFVGVVVAAGSSVRLGGDVPKPFLDLGGRSVLRRSIEALTGCPSIRGVVVVLAAGEIGGPRAAEIASLGGVLAVVAGGSDRARSVRLGIEAAGDAPHVLVHDAARPFASAELVERIASATRTHGAAVPCLRVPDTVKQVEPQGDAALVSGTLERDRLRLAQTPQGARTSTLAAALDAAAEAGITVTDEAGALERAGCPVAAVEGEGENFKITTPSDLRRARERFGGRDMDLRVGTGFDIHRVADDRPLVLGGVPFPGEPGLEGHSDADVLLHAAMDAVLGAAGLGDIGEHFPPGDPRFAGADSRALARTVAGLIGDAGFEVVNLDLMLLAERPRIRPKVPAMRESVAGCFGLAADRVGLKATTLEQLGSLGRREGMAAQAVALLRRRAEP